MHCVVALYHEERPHQGLGNELLKPERTSADESESGEPPTVRLGEVGCKARLGGLLRHYYRKAA